jgi:membrane-associated phospholipid phosphatase
MYDRSYRHVFLLATLLACCFSSLFAQETPTDNKTDASQQTSARARHGAQSSRIVSWRQFPQNALEDQKHIWLLPASLAHGRYWIPTTGFLLGTAGLVKLDPHDTPYFRRTQSFAGFNRTISSLNTGLGEGLFPAALFLLGRAHKDVSAENTALLVGEALAGSEIVSEVMKNVGRRLRPREIPPNGDFAHTWFKAGGGILINRGSFPSGHTIGAFAMAAVVAHRYRQHCWVPWVAYGAAGLVGFSRITLQAHFPSDIFAGAFLGYAIGRYVAIRSQ